MMSDKVKLGLDDTKLLTMFINKVNKKFDKDYGGMVINNCGSELKTNSVYKDHECASLEYKYNSDKKGSDRTFNVKIKCPSSYLVNEFLRYAEYWEGLNEKYDTEFTSEILRTYATDDDFDNLLGKKKEGAI